MPAQKTFPDPPASLCSERREADFQAFRAGFPALRHQAYFAICERAILHDHVLAGLAGEVADLARCGREPDNSEYLFAAARAKFARLMNVSADTIALTHSVRAGIAAVADALPLRPDGNIVVCADVEHSSNLLPWLSRGREVRRPKPSAAGGIDVGAMVAAIDARTDVVSCASVTRVSGCRTDLEALGKECRARGIFLLVDGVQSAGVLAHDLAALPVDAFVTSSGKALLGLSGFGFVYVARPWVERLARPATHHVPGSPTGRRPVAQEGIAHLDARGLSRVSALAAMLALDLLLAYDTHAIEAHALSLAARLRDGAQALGFQPRVIDDREQSHLVSLCIADPCGDPSGRRAAISRVLAAAGVAHSLCDGVVRFGVHAFNNDSDVAAALACLATSVDVR